MSYLIHTNCFSSLKSQVLHHPSNISFLRCQVKVTGVASIKFTVRYLIHSDCFSSLKSQVLHHPSKISFLRCQVKFIGVASIKFTVSYIIHSNCFSSLKSQVLHLYFIAIILVIFPTVDSQVSSQVHRFCTNKIYNELLNS